MRKICNIIKARFAIFSASFLNVVYERVETRAEFVWTTFDEQATVKLYSGYVVPSNNTLNQEVKRLKYYCSFQSVTHTKLTIADLSPRRTKLCRFSRRRALNTKSKQKAT